ncbi:MAG: hypothetical protein GX220_00205 [Treponema sp.]|nr:hypothetical protein [Treponema sp.]
MKNTQKKIKEFSIFSAYFHVITSPLSLWKLLKYLKTIIFKFFGIQFFVKFGLKKIPVYNIDHEYDEFVPFMPDKVQIYLDFIDFWIRPFSFLIYVLGWKKAKPYCREFLKLINTTYKSGAEVYFQCMTTTNRPPAGKNKYFKMIHALDPHYLCIPSLHVAICVLVIYFYRYVFEKENFSTIDKERFWNEIFADGIEITETVLFVKQHSVNCIPAAVYMMLRILDDRFSMNDGVDFIDALFVKTPEVSTENAQTIRNHIQFMFEQLILESHHEEDWTVPIIRWINELKH